MSNGYRAAFITGASSGLGAGLARRLAAEGCAVALSARREERLRALADEIGARGGRALPCPSDVTDKEALQAAIRRAADALGPIDLLVANAGISQMTLVEDFDAELVERHLRINFLGAVYAVEAVLPGMLERDRGHLVAMGSLAGYGGIPKTAAYSASKGALHNFFESLRVDLRDTGVDVTMLTPGYIRTPLTEKNLHSMPFLMDLDDALDRMMDAIRKRKGLLAIPRPLSTLAWLAQVFPTRLYDWLASKQRREKTAD